MFSYLAKLASGQPPVATLRSAGLSTLIQRLSTAFVQASRRGRSAASPGYLVWVTSVPAPRTHGSSGESRQARQSTGRSASDKTDGSRFTASDSAMILAFSDVPSLEPINCQP